MTQLLKLAQIFYAAAQNSDTPRIDEIKANKRQEIQKHIDHMDYDLLKKDTINYYSIIKEDPTLLDNIANILVGDTDFYLKIKQDKKELANAIFELMVNRHSPHYSINNTIQLWGSFLDHRLIRQYEQSLINLLAKYIKINQNKSDEDKDYGAIYHITHAIGNLLRDPQIAPYIDAAPLERIISSIHPKELPAFDNDKRQLKTTDILKLLMSQHNKKDLAMDKLKKIFSKSSPQAQHLLRSVLWQSYLGFNYDSKKFMLDEGGSPVDANMRPVAIYGKVSPANTVSWNEYSAEDKEERAKWKEIFNDYKLVPFIEF